MKQQVKWGRGNEIVVHETTVADDLAARQIARDLMALDTDPEAIGYWLQFAQLCCQTESSKGLAFKPELIRGLDLDGKSAGYKMYLELPLSIQKRWVAAADATNVIEDMELGPLPLPEGADPKA